MGEHEIVYRPKTSIKAQVPVDFVAEFTPPNQDIHSFMNSWDIHESLKLWKLYVDKSSNISEAGANMVLMKPDESILEQAMKLGFKVSNSEVEYETLLAKLRVAT